MKHTIYSGRNTVSMDRSILDDTTPNPSDIFSELQASVVDNPSAALVAADELYKVADTHLESADILTDHCSDLMATDPAAASCYDLTGMAASHLDQYKNLTAAADLLIALATL